MVKDVNFCPDVEKIGDCILLCKSLLGVCRDYRRW